MSVAKGHLPGLIERMEPSRVEAAARLLESIAAEKPAGEEKDAAEKLRRSKSSQWLATHDEELKTYRGKWILLEGDQLLAVDADFQAVSLQARKAGIKGPFIYRVPPDDLPYAGF